MERRLADPSIYVPGQADEITAANTRLAVIARQTEQAEMDWLAAQEALEGTL